jgi:hypothetical protein
MSHDERFQTLEDRCLAVAAHAARLDPSERLLLELEYGVNVYGGGVENDLLFVQVVSAEIQVASLMGERDVFESLMGSTFDEFGWLLEVNDGEGL